MLIEVQFNRKLFHSFTPAKAKLNVKVKELKVRFERSQSIHVIMKSVYPSDIRWMEGRMGELGSITTRFSGNEPAHTPRPEREGRPDPSERRKSSLWRCLKMPKAFYLQVFFALEYSYYSTEKVKFTICCFTLFNSSFQFKYLQKKNIPKIVDMQRSDTINKFILQEQLKPRTTI